MKITDAAIPVAAGWSSPFARWQTVFADLSSIDLAAQVTQRALADRQIDPRDLDRVVVGMTTMQPGSFYAGPTIAGLIGAEGITGPTLAQACATSAACVETAAAMAGGAPDSLVLVVTTDRTSNSPVLTYPSGVASGGAPLQEHWFFDNIKADPWAGRSMLETAERVAAEAGYTRQQIDEITVARYAQYTAALADNSSFQRRYLVPVEVPGRRGTKTVVDGDVGVHETTAAGLAKLDAVLPGGVVTHGAQTHPADGTAGMVVTSTRRARELAQGGAVARILATGTARAAASEMPKAPVPAAERALADAGLTFGDVAAVTMHNPFAVNDLWFSEHTGIEPERVNQYGSSLIFGHPQGPTGARLIVELLHTLESRGGGVGLFTGCAAGDTGMAVVVEVG